MTELTGSQLGYLFWDIISTLAIVEAPQVTVQARPPWASEKDHAEEAPEPRQERAVTDSLLGTIKHLYRIGGAPAMVRGMACGICLNAASILLLMPFLFFGILTDPNTVKWDETISSRLIPDAKAMLGECATTLLLSSWATAWIHIVITPPTLRIWYRRVPPFVATLRATWRPTLYITLAHFIIWKVIPRPIRYAAGFYVTDYTAPSGFITTDKIVRTLSWTLVHAADLLILLPLYMAGTRVQASLLPEDEDTIVTFDRTFKFRGHNGLQPGLLAQPRGALSFQEAWQSITRSELRRMILLRAKFVVVEVVISVVFWTVLGKSALPMHWVPWEYRH